MRVRFARTRVPLYAVAAIVAATLAFVPLPYALILPGRAVDLRDVVSVQGHPPPAARYYMTDVEFLPRVTAFQLLDALEPGARVLRERQVVPQSVSPSQYDAISREEMSESQTVAAYVAERAAHLPVGRLQSKVYVVYFSSLSKARGVLREGDVLLEVAGRPVSDTPAVLRALAAVRAGSTVRVRILRAGRERDVRVPTIAFRGRTALGTYLTTIVAAPKLPVAVRFHVPDISGSSGGLMFALDIYRSLRPGGPPAGERIAGTGTISYDGAVGPIEGAAQKLIAARRAGATAFLVPQENYAEVAGSSGIRVIPVRTFAQAVRATDDLPASNG